MGLLRDIKKEKIRKSFGKYEVFNLDSAGKQTLAEMLSDQIQINDNLDVVGDINSQTVRFIIREFTNIGKEIDEFTDEEFLEKVDLDYDLERMYRELKMVVSELVETMQYKEYMTIDIMSKMVSAVEGQEKIEQLASEFNTLMSKYNVDINFEELQKINNKTEEEIVDIVKSKIKTKPKAKRTTKKKTVK